jgi:uncharacterized protein YicC (UPF0701 family)
MTGIGYSSNRGAVAVTVRGLNARHTEISIKLPTQLEYLEYEFRKSLGAAIFRGKIDCVVRLDGSTGKRPVFADRVLFQSITRAFLELVPDASSAEKRDFAVSHAAKLAIKLVDESVEVTPEIEKNAWQSFDEALKSFLLARVREGKVLVADIKKRLRTIRTGCKRISQRAKVIARSQRESSAGGEVNQDGIFRGDITEEVVRLLSHVKEAERAIKGRECGKRLEFLLQEMLREANTMASKAQDTIIQSSVVGLKVELEKVREQALNLE